MVDLLVSEYGWDVDYCLDLSIARIRLFLATIEERRKTDFRAHASIIEWSTRMITQVTAATTGKEGKELQKTVSKIVKLSWDDGDQIEEVDADTMYSQAPGAEDSEDIEIPEGMEDLPDFVLRGSPTADNQIGSAEALLGGLGR